MDREWLLAVAIIAVPVAFFGIVEFLAYRRRRRAKLIAQRPKGRGGTKSSAVERRRQAG